MHSEKDIEALIEYIDSGEERIKGAKRVVIRNTTDFNIWYKYSLKEERCKYPSMLGVNTLTGKFINDKLSWLKEKEFKGIELTLDYLLESIEVLFEEGELTKQEVENIKMEFIKLNLGSIKNLW